MHPEHSLQNSLHSRGNHFLPEASPWREPISEKGVSEILPVSTKRGALEILRTVAAREVTPIKAPSQQGSRAITVDCKCRSCKTRLPPGKEAGANAEVQAGHKTRSPGKLGSKQTGNTACCWPE